MDELFAPPGNDWRPVSPKLATSQIVARSTFFGVVLLVVVLPLLLLSAPGRLTGAAVAVVVSLWVLMVVLTRRSARSWGYAEREDDLYIRHGYMFRKLVAVPYGRMQFVDVNAGPLDTHFGIATVTLHTASPGTSATIPGLPAAEAARLRDRLTALGEAQAAGL